MQKILIVSHDAGGAEIISSWIKNNQNNYYQYILDGPAIDIFTRKIPHLTNKSKSTLEKSILESDLVLTGTSWNSKLENQAIRLSNQNQKKVASYLEHWINYAERFQFNGTLELPDEIWVGDLEALKIANNVFTSKKVKLVPNCYFIDMKNEILKIRSTITATKKLKILYLCEPIAQAALWRYDNPYYFGYTEYEAMQYFFNCLDKLVTLPTIDKICIRLHPSEDKNKYKNLLNIYDKYPIQFSHDKTLADDCGTANLIVGCTSAALVVCLQAEANVFSCIPIENPIYKLPFNEIKDFKTWANGPICQN
jgi:hypothetical protein